MLLLFPLIRIGTCSQKKKRKDTKTKESETIGEDGEEMEEKREETSFEKCVV